MNRRIRSLGTIAAVAAALSMAGAPAAGAPSPQDRDVSLLIKRVYPSVVRVEVQNHVRRVATGVVIDKGGYIVTTALVAPKEETITIVTGEGRRIEAEFLGSDPETRLGLVRARDDKGLAPLLLDRTGDLAAGVWVAAVGISPETTPAVTQGIVSSVSEDALRLNIWVTPGSSGGPVVNGEGRMVGLLRGVFADERPFVFQFRDREQVGEGFVFSQAEAPSAGMALAVPADQVRWVVDQIKEKGRVARGWLGVSIAEDPEGRVVVGEVEPDSPAELAGLRRGDAILRFEGRELTGSEMLARQIRSRTPGTDVELEIERNVRTRKMTIKVKLGEYSQEDARRELELRFPRLFQVPAPEAPATPSPAKPGAPKAAPAQPGPHTRLPQLFERFRGSLETRKFIGISGQAITRELAEHFGVENGTGVLVSQLDEGGPAEKAGLRVGDVIVEADGRRVESIDDLIDLIQDKEKGDRVTIAAVRERKSRTFEVEIDEEERGGFLPWDDLNRSWRQSSEALQREMRRGAEALPQTLRRNVVIRKI